MFFLFFSPLLCVESPGIVSFHICFVPHCNFHFILGLHFVFTLLICYFPVVALKAKFVISYIVFYVSVSCGVIF